MNDDFFGFPAATCDSKPVNHKRVSLHHLALRRWLSACVPTVFDEVIGQRQLLAPGQPLRVAFETRRPHSMILWGPPGVGKTTLARLMADAFDLPFKEISAVLSGVKDIREAVEQAQRQWKP